ncbi:MAG TPA: DMT family transporter, partial [Candidatus Competibacteraceae bacterium]|nr:DMT family transporter [Candidatus Competibacteraceae bacterium]
NAIFLYYAAPIAMALFSPWFFGKRMTRRDMTLIGITLAGMVLFFLDHLTVTNLWGNIAAIVSGVAFAGTALLTRKLGKDAIAPLFVGNVLVAVLALPFIAAIPGPDVSGWVVLVVLGVCQVGCAYALFADGIKHLPALNLIVLSGIEPILNPLWVLLVLGELPGNWALIGGMVILASLTLRGVMNAREAG